MDKFLFLIREDLKAREEMGQEQFERNLQLMTRWVESMAQSGNYVSSDPLLATGKYVTTKQVVSDGPFIDAKEAISGFILTRAQSLEQAVSIAQTCPLVINGVAAVEVRPVLMIDHI